jgi:hypothetical protein
MISDTNPTTKALLIIPMLPFNVVNDKVASTKEPLTKFGTVVVTVALKFVPNCSEAIVTKVAQYPEENPRNKVIQVHFFAFICHPDCLISY